MRVETCLLLNIETTGRYSQSHASTLVPSYGISILNGPAAPMATATANIHQHDCIPSNTRRDYFNVSWPMAHIHTPFTSLHENKAPSLCSFMMLAHTHHRVYVNSPPNAHPHCQFHIWTIEETPWSCALQSEWLMTRAMGRDGETKTHVAQTGPTNLLNVAPS